MDLSLLKTLQDELEAHSVYRSVKDLRGLRIFMEHHVFCVWDFMSLLKGLQHEIAPSGAPWFPGGSGEVQRLVNEIVLAEETDEALVLKGQQRYVSHFEMYILAMSEVGANTVPVKDFIDLTKERGVQAALKEGTVSGPIKEFVSHTFEIIKAGGLHQMAAAFSLGRENVIPGMFRSMLQDMGVDKASAPVFHYYLNRHIDLDEDEHGPMSLSMVEMMCSGNKNLEEEALSTAEQCLELRIELWNSVESQL